MCQFLSPSPNYFFLICTNKVFQLKKKKKQKPVLATLEEASRYVFPPAFYLPSEAHDLLKRDILIEETLYLKFF